MIFYDDIMKNTNKWFRSNKTLEELQDELRKHIEVKLSVKSFLRRVVVATTMDEQKKSGMRLPTVVWSETSTVGDCHYFSTYLIGGDNLLHYL